VTSANKTESVWDYPRPAVLEAFDGHLRVEHEGRTLAVSNRAYRVLETSHPPTYYIPEADVDMGLLRANTRQSLCEWKGRARYFDLVTPKRTIANAAWTYPAPTGAFEPIAGYLSFYASAVDGCYVNGERVQPQEGDFYGGWITSNISGPFKGPPGTRGW